MDINYKEAELNILKECFREASSIVPLDNSISDSLVIKKTTRKLKALLKGVKPRCTCAKRRYDMCEDCMACSKELFSYRASFRMLQKAKEYNFTESEVLQMFKNVIPDFNPS